MESLTVTQTLHGAECRVLREDCPKGDDLTLDLNLRRNDDLPAYLYEDADIVITLIVLDDLGQFPTLDSQIPATDIYFIQKDKDGMFYSASFQDYFGHLNEAEVAELMSGLADN